MSWQSPQPAARDREGRAAVESSGGSCCSRPALRQVVLRIHLDADVVAGAADERADPSSPPSTCRRRHRERQSDPWLAVWISAYTRFEFDGATRRRSCRPATSAGPVVEPRPGRAAVARDVDTAARAAAEHRPRVHHDFPRAGEQHVRIVRVDASGPEQPVFGSTNSTRCHVLAAVRRAVDAALLLRPGRAARARRRRRCRDWSDG